MSDQHIEQLLRQGYAIVPGFLDAREVEAARENMLRYYPTAEELKRTPERYGAILEEPESLQVEFPFAGDALNDVSAHPAIIEMVERLLETKNVLLSQAAIWAKYAGTGDYEQGLHLDYQGNTLVVPRDDGDYRQVNIILYYSDVDEEMGPTFVVSQEKTRELPLWPTHRTRKKDVTLYRHERPVLAQAGDMLVFSMRTWHRASAITADHGVRFSHHLVYRSGAHNFSGYHIWASKGENPLLKKFVERATPRQREVLGFPTATDSYWNEETLAAMAQRYPAMDMSAYRVGSR